MVTRQTMPAADASAAEAPRRIPKLQVRNRIEGLSPPPGLTNSSDDITTINSPLEPSQIRIPKLQVRNRIEGLTPPLGFVNPTEDEISRIESPTSPALSLASTFSRPQFSPTNSSERVPRPPLSSQSPRVSYASRASNASPEPAQKPKKSKSVFGFLSLKEPSTTAWQQFVEEQQQQAMLKGAKSVGLTQKKLPSNVPKVNSKWDGMPDNWDRSNSSSLDIGSFVKNGSSILSRTTSRKLSGDTSKQSATSTRPSTARPSTKSSTSSRQSRKDAPKSSQSSAAPSPIATSRPSLSRTTTRSTTDRSVTSTRTANDRPLTSSRSESDDTLRIRPTMSVQSQNEMVPELPSSAESEFLLPLESMPELSLFFPPEYIPRDLTSTPPRVTMQEAPPQSENVAGQQEPQNVAGQQEQYKVQNVAMGEEPRQDQKTPVQEEPIRAQTIAVQEGSYRDETPTPKATTPDDQISEVPSMEDDSSQDHSVTQSDNASQDSPVTPDLSIGATSQEAEIEPEAKERKNSQPRRYPSMDELPQWPLATRPEDVVPKHFRTVDEIPQWPLPTKPEDVIIESTTAESTPVSAKVPPTPPNTLKRSSSLERLNFGDDVQASSDKTSFNSPPTPLGSASSPISASSPPTSPTRSPSQFITQQRSMRSLYNPYTLRGPPAFQPGRVITKDSDLATIPESDTASLRSRNSAYLAESNNKLARGDFGDPMSDGNSIAESTASSQMSAQWYLSPRERLGLGGSIKHGSSNAPWPLNGEAEEAPLVDGLPSSGPARNMVDERSRVANAGKRNTLLGVFKR